jgi:hypothetical protein
MSVTNDFVPFATGGGANVESQATYLADPALPLGNQPGTASSALNNKALRQGTFVASSLAQFIAQQTNTNTNDNGVSAQFLAQLQAAVQALPLVSTVLTTGTGTFNLTYVFFIAAGNATVGATYTNNSVTYTVSSTITAGTTLSASGNGAPLTSGTLTKATGSGDATLTFYAVRAPSSLHVRLVGGGGGGASSANSGANGTATTFGSGFLTANYGVGGVVDSSGGAGGTATIVGTAYGVALTGGGGGPGMALSAGQHSAGGVGGSSPFGGAGVGGGAGSTGIGGAAGVNSGSGGGGGASSQSGGAGGGSGGYIDVIVPSPASSYPYAVGAKGAGAATSPVGGDGGAGLIWIIQNYQ